MSQDSSVWFDADRFIDRLTERQLFRTMLEEQASTRVITLRDQSDHGKSDLLKRLEWMCMWEMDPPVAVGLVPIDQFPTVHDVVTQAAKGLKNGGCVLSRFNAAERARIDSRRASIQITGTVNSESIDGEAAGVRDVTIHPGDPDFEAQEALRAQAVEEFVEDLAEITAERPVVLLIDAYEKCGRDLAEWIALFVRNHVLNDQRRLMVVIAGQDVPTQRFRAHLKERFEEMVTARDSLSPWEREHVEELLTAHGIQYDDDDVDYLHRKIQQGWSIGRALRVIKQYQREEPENGS